MTEMIGMSDIKVKTLRGKDLTTFEASRIYRILTSMSNGDIYGKQSGMHNRLKEALQAGAKFSRLFVATEGKKGVGVGFFYCNTHESHREFRVKIVVVEGAYEAGVRQTILGYMLSHAKESARMLKRDIVLDAVCKPNDRIVNSLFRGAEFFCSKRVARKKGEKYDPLDINVHRKLISYENGETKNTG